MQKVNWLLIINTTKPATMKKQFKNLGIQFLFICFFIVSCKTEKKSDSTQKDTPISKENVISVVTQSMEFQMVDTIPSGWNTFVYKNESNETHFFLLDKYPEGKTISNTKSEILPPFDTGMDLINNGNVAEAMEAFNTLPKWFFEVQFLGGSGLIAPKHTSETTVKLEPGYYVVECYVKMPNGKFHTSMGMIKEVIVSDEDSGNLPPESTVNVAISSNEGIVFDDAILKGEQVISVIFKDQIVHENFVGHDVNLVKMTDTTNLKKLESWMNWADPKGLITPAPNGFTFLGGVNNLPAGYTGYFKVNLTSGYYAFVSEVPNAISKNMLKTFRVSE